MVKLTADNIEMRFGERLLYRFQHLSLAQNQTIHLQGDNGSGKTTLMKMFAGLIAPQAVKSIFKVQTLYRGGDVTHYWAKPSICTSTHTCLRAVSRQI